MKGLLSIFKMRFGLVLNYRMAALAGLFTQLFFGFVMVMIYLAFYESSGGENFPMTIRDTITYIWLGQAFLGLLPWNGDREVISMIRTGDFAYELVRPLDIYNYWLFKILAQRIAGTILRSVPLLLMAIFVMPEEVKLSGPSSIGALVLFGLTLVTGTILGGVISNVITISILFTIGDGIERLLPAVVTMFSGMVIPLAFFPDWAQGILRFLPFSGLVDGPYKFYLGIYGLQDLFAIVIHQLLWTLVIGLYGRLVLSKARNRIVVQGG